MKKILFLLLLIPVFAQAQTRVYVTQDQPQQIRQFRGGMEGLNYFRFPVQGGHSIPAGDSLWHVRLNPNDGQVYMWDGLTWGCISCGGGGTVDSTLYVTISRLQDSLNRVQQTLDDSTNVLRGLIAAGSADSSVFATLYRLDSVKANIRAESVKYSDTANMLADYTRVQRFLDSILAVRNLANSKQDQLNGTGFVKASGTTISYDNSTYTPTGRTITINGIAQDLSANRTWTIPGTDTTALRADIEALRDTTEDLRTDINGKEPIITPGTTADYWRGDKTWQQFPYIPDTSDFIKKSDTGSLVATPYQIDTATSRLWQMKVDTMWVSSDTFYWQRGQDVFFIAGMGGGGLDTTLADARYLRQGGDTRGVADTIGTKDNQNVIVIRNGIVTVELPVTGGMLVKGNSATTNYVARLENSAGNVGLQVDNNRSVGIGKAPADGFILDVTGGRSTGALMRLQNTSATGISGMTFLTNLGATAGYIGFANTSSLVFPFSVVFNSTSTIPLRLAYNGVTKVELTTSGEVKITPLAGTGTGVVTADENGILVRDTNVYVTDGGVVELTDPSGDVLPSANIAVIITISADASVTLPDDPPLSTRVAIKVFGTSNTLTVAASGGGEIDGEADTQLMPKDGNIFYHIGSNNWVILNM